MKIAYITTGNKIRLTLSDYNFSLDEWLKKQGGEWFTLNKSWYLDLDIQDKLLKKLQREKWGINMNGISLEQKQDKIDFSFKTEPMEHQIDGIKFLTERTAGLLADEQGLGKTKQIIDTAGILKQQGKITNCLILCGINALKYNWINEIQKHSNESVRLLGNGKGVLERIKDIEPAFLKNFFIVTNIESIRDKELLKTLNNTTKRYKVMLVLDEAHKCKSPTAVQSKALLKINADRKYALTGTPIMNSPLDIYQVLRFLEVEKHNYFQFINYYAVKGGFMDKEIVGFRNLADLKEITDKVTLRRTKADKLNLPPKIYTEELLEMGQEQKKLYKEVKAEIVEQLDLLDSFTGNPLEILTRLRQVTSCPSILTSNKVGSIKEDRIKEIMEELQGEKVIIYSNWTSVTDRLKETLKEYQPVFVTGKVSQAQRIANIDTFKESKDHNLLIGTIGALGTGFTITECHNIVFIDEPWNSALKEQAEDRCHRIGTMGTLNVRTLICRKSIDEKIRDLVIKKSGYADAMMDNKIEFLNGMLD